MDLEVDPPPDLAIEIDITSSSLNRMVVYADLRVLELWRYDGESLVIYPLQPDGAYRPCATSPSFPGLRPVEVVPSDPARSRASRRAGRPAAWPGARTEPGRSPAGRHRSRSPEPGRRLVRDPGRPESGVDIS